MNITTNILQCSVTTKSQGPNVYHYDLGSHAHNNTMKHILHNNEIFPTQLTVHLTGSLLYHQYCKATKCYQVLKIFTHHRTQNIILFKLFLWIHRNQWLQWTHLILNSKRSHFCVGKCLQHANRPITFTNIAYDKFCLTTIKKLQN